jgi:hypothetical protein
MNVQNPQNGFGRQSERTYIASLCKTSATTQVFFSIFAPPFPISNRFMYLRSVASVVGECQSGKALSATTYPTRQTPFPDAATPKSSLLHGAALPSISTSTHTHVSTHISYSEFWVCSRKCSHFLGKQSHLIGCFA